MIDRIFAAFTLTPLTICIAAGAQSRCIEQEDEQAYTVEAVQVKAVQAVPLSAPVASDKPERQFVGRYDGLNITADDIDLLAKIVWLESRGESAEGQQAVAEVVLNRVLSADFPDNVHAVMYQPRHFSPARVI